MLLTLLTFVGAALWCIILLLPWRPWSTREFLDGEPDDCNEDLSNITVLIPARNEAEVIQATLAGVMAQGRDVKVILVDDQSEDKTAALAGKMFETDIKIISGRPSRTDGAVSCGRFTRGFTRWIPPLCCSWMRILNSTPAFFQGFAGK